MSLSPNTQAILLLTAPLIAGRGEPSSDPLTPGEYKKMARLLRDISKQPADFLSIEAGELIRECKTIIDGTRIERLLGRGFLLSQAIERWQARAIWVMSRADVAYPRQLKARLKDDAPPILYGCGETAILDTGGLAVVGSRHVDDALVTYTENIGRLVAGARQTLISGGARGIDQAAMRGALEAGGRVSGILADSLEQAALTRDHREFLMDGRLVLVSPYDPVAGFNVGHAMQRNKLIYALSDAALVVSSDYQKGGTWAGAVEQLDKFMFVPIYVRSSGEIGKGLEALQKKGARPWPNPTTPEALNDTLAESNLKTGADFEQQNLPFDSPVMVKESMPEELDENRASPLETLAAGQSKAEELSPAEELFATVRGLLVRMDTPKTEVEVADELRVTKSQAKEWLQRLVQEAVLEKIPKPTRYRSVVADSRFL